MMTNRFLTIILFFLISSNSFFAQNKINLENNFEIAANKYDVPADVLKSIAYAETRFYNVIPSGEKNENGMPPVYGIMGLRNDDWFGHSLTEGAKLINASPSDVTKNVNLNIEAAAALLSKYADDLNIDRTNIQSWRPVIEKYSGIPQEDVKPFYSFDVFKVMYDGTNINGVAINQHKEINMAQFGDDVNPKDKLKNIEKINSTKSIQSTDYPPAVWDPSPNFTPNAITQKFMVVHDTEGGFAGSVSWLKNPASSASSHYIIRSSDGYIIQLVREKDRAWHARSWNNVMLGVEHEGYVDNPAYFTEAMYQSSAALYKHFARKYGIPVDTFRIVGHYQHLKNWWVDWINNTWNPNNPGATVNPLDNSHTDPGKYWNWQHYFDLIDAGAVAPKVISSNPSSVSDTVWNNAKIRINFDIPMAPITESAFSISPNVDGKFSWEDTSKTLVFTPTQLLDFSTKYTVTISQQAASVFYKNIDTSYSFEFYSKPNIPLNVLTSYPNDNSNYISTTAKIIINFNSPLIFSSLGGNILFQDSSGKSIGLRHAGYEEVNGKGQIYFSPSQPLNEEETYKITIKNGVESINGNHLDNEFVLYFKTSKDNYVQGTIVDNFNTIENWKQPQASNYTSGIDTNLTAFSISTYEKVDGTSSAQIEYKFIQSGAELEVSNDNFPSISSSPAAKFGLWIYGDLNYNLLQLRFSSGSNNNITIPIDTLNWTGWKFVEFPTTLINANNDFTLKGIQIKYLENGSDFGAIYFDNIQWRDSTATDIKDKNNTAVLPKEFKLFQNYPNPFNPSTNIKYAISSKQFVSLKVYNILGKEVATLVNKEQAAGNYEVEFSGVETRSNASLPSGVYFYRLQAGNFVSTKKLILLK